MAEQMPTPRPTARSGWEVTIEDQRKAVDAAFSFAHRLLELRRDFDHKVSALVLAGGSRVVGVFPAPHFPLPGFIPSGVSVPSFGAGPVAAEEATRLRTAQAAPAAAAEAEAQAEVESAVAQQAAESESAPAL